MRCCRDNFIAFRSSLYEDDKLAVTKGMLGNGKAAARVVMKLFESDTEFMKELKGHIRLTYESKLDLQQAFADAAADTFYGKSASEYRIIQENFKKVSQILQ